MKKFRVAAAILLVTLLSVAILAIFKPGTERQPPARPPAIPVEALTVAAQSYQVLIQSQGIVEASTRATLAAQVSGNVVSRNVRFERGGSFKKDELLVTIDDSDYLAALKFAVANQSKAKVKLEEEQARSTAAIKDWKRQGYKKQPSNFVARLPQVAAAKAELESTDAAVIKAELDLSRTRIKAPFDGRVIDGAIDVGNYVTPGTPLGSIVESGQLKVALPVSSQWRDRLDWNQPFAEAAIRLPGIEGAQWLAAIDKASADISRASRQFYLMATIDTDSASRKDIGLLIGDYISASIKGRVMTDVFVIPRGALHDGRFVWLIDNNKLYKREVNVVWTDANAAVIDRGLLPGEQINITPVGAVVSGTEVRLLQSVSAPQPLVTNDAATEESGEQLND